ncbi:Ig-like domain-containing protein [Microcystis aeruginosa FBCC-A68]|uniref:beta strand repeat-containing protein n=1 Tax=Microcystis aeruginosa TaxID=1126 RepID=UPI0009A15971|nr:Ig-like domain-containing protein [Microcystis aeruginosa]
MTLQEGTYTWEYGDTTQALWFTASYNTVTNQWTVDMKKGSMDLNALWWSNGDSNADGAIKLLSKDNSLNMNGTNIVWDGYDKISDTGLTGKEHNGSSLLTAGNTYTYSYSKDQGVEIEALLAGGVTTLGVRATSVNGTDGIKAVDGQFVFVPYDATPPTLTVNIVDTSLNDGDNNSLVTFEFSEDVNGFTAGDVSVSGGTLSDFTQVDGNSYTAIFTANDAVETTGSVSVAADSYTDIAGNNGGAGTDTVTIDTLNPTLALDIVDASLNDGDNSSLVTFEFSEDVAGFDNSDVSVSGGTLSDFTQVDGNSYTAIFTADDAVETTGSVSVAADSYTDIAGNNGGAGTDTVTIDTLNPTLALDIVDASLNDGDNSSLVTFEFSEDVAGFDNSDVNVSGGTLSDFTQVDGNSYTAIFTADDAVETTGSVSVAADSYTDIAGNNGGAGTDTVTIDTLNPTLALDIVDASLNDGDNSSLVTFEFSEDVAGFDNSDVNVSGGTLSDFTLVDGNSYTAIFTADDAVETTGSVSVAADSYTDIAGNNGGAGTDTVTIDTLNPTLALDIVDASLNDGDNSSLVTFEFSEDVAGFDNSDVNVSGGTLSDFTQVDGNSYTAIFTADDAVETTGSVSVAADSYTDIAGNNGGAGTDTVTIDTLNPTLALDIVDASLNDGDNSSLVTFEFSEDVAGFDNSDVNVSGGTLSDFTQVDGNSYTAIFTADDAVETTGSVSVAADSYTDIAGNNGGAGTDTVTIDTLNPTVGINFASQLLTGQNFSTTVTFQFSEAVSGFAASDVTLTNGVLSNFTGSGSSYTATFIATNFQSPTGTVAVSNDYFDTLGNQGVANSANIAMTVGGGPDPNDGPSGGSIVIGSGTAGADSITGSTGNDNLSGLDGADTINGGDGNDIISGGNGYDIIRGGTGNDTISGIGGFDLIYGGSGNDSLTGNNGNDTIVGGFGNDSLAGSGGNDTFQFLSIYDQQDVITDFGIDANTIVFDITGASAFTSLGSVSLGTTNYTDALAAGYLIYSGGVLSYDADGSAGSTFTPLAIVSLTGTLTPTLSNTNVLFQNL